jgi:hypothetical protein
MFSDPGATTLFSIARFTTWNLESGGFMDFAVCPACGQSVLDDEADDCPFCGSSMKAKPGSKPAAPAKGAAPTGKAAPGKATGKPAAPADDDFPFDAETNLPQTAVQASPAPSKSKSLKVQCPMCDTAGYVPPTTAGKQVRCANAKCPMPIFQAPAPEPEAPPPPPPKKKGNPVLLGVITAAVVGGVGYLIWMVAGQPSNTAPDVKLLTPEDIAAMKKGSSTSPQDHTVSPPGNNATTTSTDTETTSKTQEPSAGPQPSVLIAQVIKSFPELVLQSGNQNRSKPLCRRLAAETAALAGDAPAMREHLAALMKLNPDLAFYRIGASVEHFWREHRQKNTAAAQETLNQAVGDAAKLPKFGRDHLDLATQLAAALAAVGRTKEARELIAAHQTVGLKGEASAYLQSIAADRTLVDASQRIALRPIVFRQAPQAAATTAVLVLRGEPAAALAWAKSWDEPHLRAECLIALSEAAIAGLVAFPEADIATLPAESQALLWARVARLQSARNQAEAAKASVAKSTTNLEAVTIPAEFSLPDLRGLLKWKDTPTTALVTLAAAGAELAVAQHQVAKDDAAAAKALDLSMQACRALGPASGPIQKLLALADQLGPNGLRQKLKADLELKTDDQARQQVGLYRKALENVSNAAQERFTLQTTILSRAAQAGLEDAVWTIVSARTADPDAGRKEPYFPTEVTSWLVERFRARSANDLVQAVTAAAAEAVPGGIKRPAPAEFEEQLAAGKFREALAVLQRPEVDPDQREALGLLGALRLAAQDPVEATWQYVGQINDTVIREHAWEWAALIAARRGQGPAVAKQIGNVNGATEKISLARGMVAGLQAPPEKK